MGIETGLDCLSRGGRSSCDAFGGVILYHHVQRTVPSDGCDGEKDEDEKANIIYGRDTEVNIIYGK